MSISQPIRILLVDSHSLARTGLRMLLDSWKEIAVVGDTGDASEVLTMIQRERPQIVLMELEFKSGAATGLDLLPKLVSAGQARVIVFTHLQDVALHHSAIQRGARGLMLTQHSPEQLRNAILKVHAGEVWFDDKLITSIVTMVAKSSRHLTGTGDKGKGAARLTPRENEVSQLVGEGLSNKEIAKRLFISETTVRHHLTSIFAKLDITNRLELIIHLLRPETGKPPAPSIPRRNPMPHVDAFTHSGESRRELLKRISKRRSHVD
jgi:two-component system, NarL family, nitrate/nitrite response regulator NarL